MAIVQNLYQYLDTVGDGSGTTNANVDGSTPVEFKLVPARSIAVTRMIVTIRDTGAFPGTGYGGIAGGLDPGLTITTKDSGGNVTDLCGGVPLVTTYDWNRMCYDGTSLNVGGSDNYFHARWTFAKSGAPLHLESGDSLIVTINDDCTGLVEHYFFIQAVHTGSQ